MCSKYAWCRSLHIDSSPHKHDTTIYFEISEKGWREAARSNNEIKEGLNIISGRVVNKNVSEAFNVEYFNPDDQI